MSQFVSSLQFVASSSTDSAESVRQFVTPYIDNGVEHEHSAHHRRGSTPSARHPEVVVR